jgi:DNA-binding Lrp family transcriptional regulator
MPAEEMKRNERAFIMIEVEPGREDEIMRQLLKFEEVKEAHEITGEKDILVVLEIEKDIVAPGLEKIANFVTHKVSKINGVRDTETIIPTASWIKTQ